jgi:hypothetical protein
MGWMYYTCRADLDMVQHDAQMIDGDLLREHKAHFRADSLGNGS